MQQSYMCIKNSPVDSAAKVSNSMILYSTRMSAYPIIGKARSFYMQ